MRLYLYENQADKRPKPKKRVRKFSASPKIIESKFSRNHRLHTFAYEFAAEYERCEKDNVKRKDEEERRKKTFIKEKQDKERKRTYKQNNNLNAVEDEHVLDNLLEKLASGQYFRDTERKRPRRKQRSVTRKSTNLKRKGWTQIQMLQPGQNLSDALGGHRNELKGKQITQL